jgi:tetratricopeptide (TPR) repeat protein
MEKNPSALIRHEIILWSEAGSSNHPASFFMKKQPPIFSLCQIVALLFLASCAHAPEQTTRAQGLYHEGQAFLSEGRLEEAFTRFSESLALSREEHDPKGVAHNLNEIGILQTQRREFDAARACFLEAQAIYRDLDMAPEVSKSLNNLALTHVLDKAYAEAAAVYEKLLAWDVSTGNSLGEAITLTNLGHLYEVHLQQPGKALAAYERALILLTELGEEKRSALLQERVQRFSSEGKQSISR